VAIDNDYSAVVPIFLDLIADHAHPQSLRLPAIKAVVALKRGGLDAFMSIGSRSWNFIPAISVKSI
jgi:hypothetical protein